MTVRVRGVGGVLRDAVATEDANARRSVRESALHHWQEQRRARLEVKRLSVEAPSHAERERNRLAYNTQPPPTLEESLETFRRVQRKLEVDGRHTGA